MDKNKLTQLLNDVKEGRLDINHALHKLRTLPFENLGHTKIDNHRDLRQGIPEVVYCESKTPEQILSIMQRILESHNKVLGTRANPEKAAFIQKHISDSVYDKESRLLMVNRPEEDDAIKKTGMVMVITAGTSDIPVAEEAAKTLEFLNVKVERAFDIGVAGIHRLFDVSDKLYEADVIICIAGMEGALTSVVGGLVSCPVIGVPTSVGYGTSLQGFAPMLTMLNSCATGVAIVNIDNGFGAATVANSIIQRIQKYQ
ncbi:MAG: nickel pincer cofactor biosynthesis protein LarB [Bacteroidales bacterium]|nr:nickel pincer cofactor biosynthesis protein LarB [Bacteroidales bacterium]MCF8405156.1 nickel pincer cofactor biosynthesis protein LarB [Bacteroidales bacterium]